MLGEEGHHGGGRTIEAKIVVIQRLVERCGFDAVYFESGVYEFVDLGRRLAAGTSAPEQVGDAIGGIWNRSSEIDPLVDYLHVQASAGRIRLGGLDAQLPAATSGFEKDGLVHDLLQGLQPSRRSACADSLARHTNWRYDDEHPFDTAERDRLIACLRDAVSTTPSPSARRAMAQAALAALMNQGAGVDPNWRERHMAELFRWHQRQSPRPPRVVIWTANVHAARTLEPLERPLRPFAADLAAEYGDQLATIAFTSLSGTYGRGVATPIPQPAPESLEVQSIARGDEPLRYLGRLALARLGVIEASLFSYGKADRADWSQLFDGVVVLREEKPQTLVRPAAPRFARPAPRAQRSGGPSVAGAAAAMNRSHSPRSM